MLKPIDDFLDFLNPGATIADLRSACRRIVDSSDLVNCASIEYTASERDAIAEGILQFILAPDVKESHEIIFDSDHGLVGTSIEIYEFASMFSSEFLSDYCKATWDNPFPDSHSHSLRILEYYTAILFRYSWCVRTDTAAFPVSEIIEFAAQCDLMRKNQGQETDLPEILHLVMLALRECEES